MQLLVTKLKLQKLKQREIVQKQKLPAKLQKLVKFG
jgi:hypothetical protein